jgi:hypothetical protein
MMTTELELTSIEVTISYTQEDFMPVHQDSSSSYSTLYLPITALSSMKCKAEGLSTDDREGRFHLLFQSYLPKKCA